VVHGAGSIDVSRVDHEPDRTLTTGVRPLEQAPRNNSPK
jgi:hypothetical protein